MLSNDKEKYYQNFFLIAADKYNFNVLENGNFLLIDLNKYNEEKTFEELHQIYKEEMKKTNERLINEFFFLMSFNFETIFETKKNKNNSCLFLKTMYAYSSFFEKIIKSNKREIDCKK